VSCKESAQIQLLSREDHHNYALVARNAALKHMQAIAVIEQQPYEKRDSAELDSRLRSFFWELIAVWDLLHAWANIRYQLGLNGRDMTPYAVQKKMSEKDDCSKALRILQNAAKEDWFCEVKIYRNYAHRSYVNFQTLVLPPPSESHIFLMPAREGQQKYVPVGEQLNTYIGQMSEVGMQIQAIKTGKAV
jgi:hypothetical protein